MPLSIENAVGQKLMLGFHGLQPPAEILEMIQRQHIGGATLFRSMNLEHPAQIRELTDCAAMRRSAVGSAALSRGQLPVELPEA